MITKFDKYNESLIDRKLIKILFSKSYELAIKNIKKIHGSIKEDHILELVNQYMVNEYGVNMIHSKEALNYIKHLVHNKFKNNDKK